MTYSFATGQDVYEGPTPPAFWKAVSLGCVAGKRPFVVTKWKLTDSERNDLEMVTGQRDVFLGVPVAPKP